MTQTRIFSLDQRIRYVGITDMSYHVIISRMRKGVESLTSSDLDSSFVSMVPRTMVDGALKLERDCGSMEIISIRYRKVFVVFYKAGDYIVVISFDPSVETPFHTKLASELARILH